MISIQDTSKSTLLQREVVQDAEIIQKVSDEGEGTFARTRSGKLDPWRKTMASAPLILPTPSESAFLIHARTDELGSNTKMQGRIDEHNGTNGGGELVRSTNVEFAESSRARERDLPQKEFFIYFSRNGVEQCGTLDHRFKNLPMTMKIS
ncbi:hypothetical protein SAY87_004048 [Trapa incisa]|uniref:Uncharacterized protein n=1 Tax=Trapa incisa TaxID=236973 RepID=A0AAN7JN50_9MYRT|nr:hypothetical protein SAY87_004048 [Trapa incisa]